MSDTDRRSKIGRRGRGRGCERGRGRERGVEIGQGVDVVLAEVEVYISVNGMN